MISALILILTWIAITSLMARRSTLPRDIVPILSFICSQACLVVFSYLLIHFGSNPIPKYIIILYLVLAAFNLTRGKMGLLGVKEIANLFSSDQMKCGINLSSSSAKRSLRSIIHLRILVTIVSLSLILLFAALIASPSSWDSYTYNLSRVVLMIIRGSPLLEDSASIPQATFPIGHDLLYYPDLLFGNLRGLGLINSLEFVVLTGTLLKVCDLIPAKVAAEKPLRVFQLEFAKLLTVCLLFSSDQQILQSLSVKNDFVITLFFSISVLLALVYLRETASRSFRLPIFLASSLLVAVISYTSKSYGGVSFIPTSIALLLNYRHFLSGRIDKKIQFSSLKSTDSQIFLLLSCLTISLVLVVVRFNHFIDSEYASTHQYEISVQRFINRFPILSDYIYAGFINFARFFLNFFAYPYSTLLKTNPSSPDDYFLGLSPVIKFLSQNNFGVAQGYVYSLSRYRNEDVSLSGPLTHILFLLAAITFVYCGTALRWTTYFSRLYRWFNTKSVILILFSSFSAGFIIFSILAYHNWTLKYVGFIYVCWLPLLSFLLSINVFELSGVNDEVTDFPHYVAESLRVGSFALVISSLTMLLSLALINSRLFSLSLSNEPYNVYKIYDEYLSGKGYKTQNSRIDFLNQFNAESGKIDYTLCYHEEVPTLAPFLELMKSGVRSDFLALSSNINVCKPSDKSSTIKSSRRNIILP